MPIPGYNDGAQWGNRGIIELVGLAPLTCPDPTSENRLYHHRRIHVAGHHELDNEPSALENGPFHYLRKINVEKSRGDTPLHPP